MGVDRVLEGSECDLADYDDSIGVGDEVSVGVGGGGSLKKRDGAAAAASANLSTTVVDPMDVDGEQQDFFDDDYAGESDDYQ